MRLATAALLLLPALVSAEAPPTTTEAVLARWADAVGAGKRVRAVTIRSDSTLEGVSGTTVRDITAHGYRETVRQAEGSEETICEESACWLRDWNGNVQRLAGRDLEDARTVAIVARLLYGGGVREVKAGRQARLMAERAPGGGIVLRFTPEGAIPFDLVLGATTFLPERITRTPYDDAIVEEPGDWRAASGLEVPFSVRQTGGESGSENTTSLREVVPGRPEAQARLERPADGPSDVRFASGRSATGIPFDFENAHIMIACSVNGSKPIWFLLDTGAEANFINASRLEEFGLAAFGASSVTGGGHATAQRFTRVRSLRVGGVELVDQRDPVIDVRGLERIFGMPMGGLLGYDFLSRFVVRVDYRTKTIDLHDPATWSYRGKGRRVPFVLEENHPHVPATIRVAGGAAIAADMIVDAGAADTVNLTSAFVKRHDLLRRARTRPPGAPNTLPGSEKEFFAQTSVRGKLESITLGPFVLGEVPTNLMVGTTGAYSAESFSGTIGEGVLRRFDVIYDYARGSIVLEPNAEFKTPFPPRATFGATFLSDGPDLKVFAVTAVGKGSPAEDAGLRAGDVVTALDGTPAAETTLGGLRRALSEEGTHHVLTVKRATGETATLDVTVKLTSLDER